MLKGRGQPMTDDERNAMRARRVQGAAAWEIAAEFHRSEQAVWKACVGLKVERPGNKPRIIHAPRIIRMTPQKREEILDMRAAGLSLPEICDRSGFGKSSVSEVMAQARRAGDPRAIPRPAVEQSVAASVAHREGGTVTPDAPALAPNSAAISLHARGFAAHAVAGVTFTPRVERAVAAKRPVIRKVVSQGPFRIGGSHSHKMEQPKP